MPFAWCVWCIVEQRPKQSSTQIQDLSQNCYLDVEFPVIDGDTVKAIEVSAEECIQWGLDDPNYGNSEEARIDMYTYALNRRKSQMEDLERQIGRAPKSLRLREVSKISATFGILIPPPKSSTWSI